MASTIKVNNIQNQCGANIINESANTITLGASGDTITLACGASQTGFGRTGTVDWDTTAKTASFTAVSGNGYFVNTTSGAITVTLPASPSAGDIVAVADYAGTSNTNNITIGRNGSNINGSASDIIITIDGKSITLVYVDGTQGWKITDNADQTTEGPLYITATGGTITTCGDFKIHTFTGPGTFCVSQISNTPANNEVSYIVVAGGGGGGGEGGGGGAGGFRESKSGVDCYSSSPLEGATPITVTATSFPIAVGAGGAAATCDQDDGTNGVNSTFSTITSAGGGFGGSKRGPVSNGNSGGSGGGVGRDIPGSAGAGNTPPVSPPQGNNGGTTPATSGSSGGGGGGATAAGSPATSPGPNETGGPGGAGATTHITGSPATYAGGGGGGSIINNSANAGTGGPGGGGNAGYAGGFAVAQPGTANTGGGGGGDGSVPGTAAGAGGSGIVVIRYRYQ